MIGTYEEFNVVNDFYVNMYLCELIFLVNYV